MMSKQLNQSKPLLKSQNKHIGILLKSPYFWIILFITISLYLLYYETPYILLNKALPGWDSLIMFEFVNHANGLLLFIPLILTLYAFSWPAVLIFWSISIVTVLPYLIGMNSNIIFLIINLLFAALPIFAISFVVMQLNWRNKERKIMANRDAERRAYLAQILKAQEEERQRIAYELHDDTIQILLVIVRRLKSLLSEVYTQLNDKNRGEADWISNAILGVSESIRRISRALRPSILDDVGLVPAINWLVAQTMDDTMEYEVTLNGIERKLPSDIEVQIFRILQESLNNVKRHSNAKNLWVELSFKSDVVEVRVRDNGIGFSLPSKLSALISDGKLGLAGIRQRASFIGGTLSIDSEPGKGTLVSLILPIGI